MAPCSKSMCPTGFEPARGKPQKYRKYNRLEPDSAKDTGVSHSPLTHSLKLVQRQVRNKELLGIEPRLRESESRVMTITLQSLC